jgi:hypothetical protein
MSVNARKEQYEHAELFGKPVLFTDSRIDRTTVPKEFYCYDLRGSDRDPGKPTTVENQVTVNHAGTVLAPEPIVIPKEGFHKICGKLNFLGECLTLQKFCKERGIELQPGNRKFIMRPSSSDEVGLFFTPTRERDIEMGTIGHVRIDFRSEGKEFWHTWWPCGDEALNSLKFKTELQELVNELRENGPLKDLNTMYSY